MKIILITEVAGFIDSNLVKKYRQSHSKNQVVGVDIMSDCYDVSLKEKRLEELM